MSDSDGDFGEYNNAVGISEYDDNGQQPPQGNTPANIFNISADATLNFYNITNNYTENSAHV